MKTYAPLLVALALLAVLVFQWLGWPPPLPTADPAGAPATEPAAAPTQPDLLAQLQPRDNRDDYAAIVERPLFRPDRQPAPPSDEQPGTELPEASVELSVFDLNAVLIAPGVVSAWVRDPAQPKLRRLRIGDDLQGWSVLEIQEDRVLLERQGQQDALILRDYSQSSPATAPAPPARKILPRPPPRAPVRAEPPKQ